MASSLAVWTWRAGLQPGALSRQTPDPKEETRASHNPWRSPYINDDKEGSQCKTHWLSERERERMHVYVSMCLSVYICIRVCRRLFGSMLVKDSLTA